MRTVYPIDSVELHAEMIDGLRQLPSELAEMFTTDTADKISKRLQPNRLLDRTADTNYFDGAYLTDDEGTVYETLNFNIQSVYKVDGDLWISGNEFRINWTKYSNHLLDMVEEAYGVKLEGRD